METPLDKKVLKVLALQRKHPNDTVALRAIRYNIRNWLEKAEINIDDKQYLIANLYPSDEIDS